MAAFSKEMRNPATCLTDDLIVEILSRLPVKSVCRFKCVSKHWLGLISHPDHRKRMPQTLAGFFYHTKSSERFPETARHFSNVTGRGAPLISPSLSFLPGHADITLVDSCNGLLLCRSPTAAGANRYVVCNPATEQWVALPESSQAGEIRNARVGFDPAFSPNFHVFEFVEIDGYEIDGLEIYSSETGQWAHRDNGWSDDVDDAELTLLDGGSTVFFNGFLHVLATATLLVVDTEGNSWRTIPEPHGIDEGYIGQSQGDLYYLNTFVELSVYVLEDYKWIYKYSVSTSELLGNQMTKFGLLQDFNVITIHPECRLIFFVSNWDDTIRCYDMDSSKVHVLRNIGCELDDNRYKRCLSYVPLFSDLLAA